MEKKGIELLEKPQPLITEKAAAATAQTFGVPLILLIQAVFLILLGFNFKLHRDIKALSASVADKEGVLAQAQDLENLFLTTQRKLDTIASVRSTLCYPCAFRVLTGVTPALVDINSISLEAEKLTLAADTSHGASFALFVSNLIQEEAIDKAAITSGNLSAEGKFAFTMELVLNKEKVNLRVLTSP